MQGPLNHSLLKVLARLLDALGFGFFQEAAFPRAYPAASETQIS